MVRLLRVSLGMACGLVFALCQFASAQGIDGSRASYLEQLLHKLENTPPTVRHSAKADFSPKEHISVAKLAGDRLGRDRNEAAKRLCEPKIHGDDRVESVFSDRSEAKAAGKDRLSPGDWIGQALPLFRSHPGMLTDSASEDIREHVAPMVADAGRGPAILPRMNHPLEQERFGSGVSNDYKFFEIEVDHSEHTLKLMGRSNNGSKRIVFQCSVGLGSPSFPTPPGLYYVTHIYDDDPWWIPPPNRAWAAGQSPSKRVYGGTMAPLLKKKPVRRRRGKTDYACEDMIDGKRVLDDYGYRFHGTNSPRSIGHNQSHGCVRMLPKDAGKLASLIKQYVGTDGQGETENGVYKVLSSTVRLRIVR